MQSPANRFSRGNCASNNFRRLRAEWSHSPYRSDEIEAYNKPSDEVGTRATCCIVYIRSFLRTPHDFVYCIHGPANLVKFHSGLHGGEAVCRVKHRVVIEMTLIVCITVQRPNPRVGCIATRTDSRTRWSENSANLLEQVRQGTQAARKAEQDSLVVHV